MIANPNPSVTAGALRAEVAQRQDIPSPTFLVLIAPQGNPLITLLQIAKLHDQGALPHGCDLTFGDVPDTSNEHMAFTYTGSIDSFWEGLARLTEEVLIDALELVDAGHPSYGHRTFSRLLYAYQLPPLGALPEVDVAEDGSVLGDPAWGELG